MATFILLYGLSNLIQSNVDSLFVLLKIQGDSHYKSGIDYSQFDNQFDSSISLLQ